MSLKPLSAPASNTVLADCSADQQPVESEATVDGVPDGAYLIAGVTVTENGEVTQYSRDQIKIYTQGRFMYAFNNAVIESIDVGAGDASWSNGVMVEVPRVNHHGPVSGYCFDVAIDQTETGFEQTVIGMEYEGGRLLDMVEVWDKASTATSAFDGLWQLQTRESNEPNISEFAETKMIGGGHYIWLQNAVFEGEPVKEFCFGTFEVDANGDAIETAMTSSMPDYEGTVSAVKMELLDKNHFTQSFVYNGETVTQTYMRM
jgi:hypothetical protein